jgi:hypothetical protein
MKSWWDMTKEEQDARMAIEPLTMGAVSEAFRHPASYAELRLIKTIWKYAEDLSAAKKRIAELEAAPSESNGTAEEK